MRGRHIVLHIALPVFIIHNRQRGPDVGELPGKHYPGCRSRHELGPSVLDRPNGIRQLSGKPRSPTCRQRLSNTSREEPGLLHTEPSTHLQRSTNNEALCMFYVTVTGKCIIVGAHLCLLHKSLFAHF